MKPSQLRWREEREERRKPKREEESTDFGSSVNLGPTSESAG